MEPPRFKINVCDLRIPSSVSKCLETHLRPQKMPIVNFPTTVVNIGNNTVHCKPIINNVLYISVLQSELV